MCNLLETSAHACLYLYIGKNGIKMYLLSILMAMGPLVALEADLTCQLPRSLPGSLEVTAPSGICPVNTQQGD